MRSELSPHKEMMIPFTRTEELSNYYYYYLHKNISNKFQEVIPSLIDEKILRSYLPEPREGVDTVLQARALEQVRNNFHDTTPKEAFQVVQRPGYIELTAQNGKRGYIFCGKSLMAEYNDPEVWLNTHIAQQRRLGNPVVLKIVDYESGIAGFRWEHGGW